MRLWKFSSVHPRQIHNACSRLGSHAERLSQRGLLGDRNELPTMAAEGAAIVATKAARFGELRKIMSMRIGLLKESSH